MGRCFIEHCYFVCIICRYNWNRVFSCITEWKVYKHVLTVISLFYNFFFFQHDFLLRHYDKGPCKNKLGHSRASVIWHRTQVKLFWKSHSNEFIWIPYTQGIFPFWQILHNLVWDIFIMVGYLYFENLKCWIAHDNKHSFCLLCLMRYGRY